jgi:ABC-type lipoprotein export system ATPase subunit
VAIARALAMEPDIILADEPTGNLDTGSGSDVMSLLGALSAQGRTLVVVTHDQHLARRAHRVVEIRDGVIVSDAPATA